MLPVTKKEALLTFSVTGKHLASNASEKPEVLSCLFGRKKGEARNRRFQAAYSGRGGKDDYIRRGKRTGQGIRVSSPQEVKKALAYPTAYLLFDTYTQGQYGGSGKGFDLQLLKKVDRPFFLAGGLKADNVEKSIKEVRPFCVDISSGAETDGVKDEEKIRRLVEIVM